MYEGMPIQICVDSSSDGSGFNPLWLILIVNFAALFAVPFFTYVYSHINNLKVLKEKWLSHIRDVGIDLLEISERMYKLNDRQYSMIRAQQDSEPLLSETKQSLQEAQSQFTAKWNKMRLLFKEGDPEYDTLDKFIDDMKKASDEPVSLETNEPRMDRDKKIEADEEYLRALNDLLYRKWQDVQGLRYRDYIWPKK